MKETIIVTAWNNGKYHDSGAGYGLKLRKEDRDEYISKNWSEVNLKPDGRDEGLVVNINRPTFWHKCPEFLHKEIGIWLIEKGHKKWKKGLPPKFKMENLNDNCFVVY